MKQSDDDATTYETIINEFSSTWTLLLQYDEDSLERPKQPPPTQKNIDYRKS